jgi:uncharacterized protein (TIGR02270 family)
MTDAIGAVLWDVVDEHLDEADFLLRRWLADARSTRIGLAALRKTVDERLLAHLDGLVIGGAEVADRLLWPVLRGEREGPRSAAALAMLLGQQPSAADKLASAFRRTSHADLRSALLTAFKISSRTDLAPLLHKALRPTDPPAAQAAVLDVLAARREDPGPALATVAAAGHPTSLPSALRSAAAATLEPLRQLVEKALFHEEPAVRAAALRTAMIWNLRSAWPACLEQAADGSAEAMLLLALVGGSRDLAPLTDALASPDRRLAALWALGFTGRVQAVEACLPVLDDADPRAARLAAEAIASITGLAIPEKPRSPVDDHEADHEADHDDNDSPIPTSELPAPDATPVRDWWASQRARFAPRRRYINGEPFTAASLQRALREGPLRRTGPLACELAIRTGGRVQLPALRMGYPSPVVPPNVRLEGPPTWR